MTHREPRCPKFWRVQAATADGQFHSLPTLTVHVHICNALAEFEQLQRCLCSQDGPGLEVTCLLTLDRADMMSYDAYFLLKALPCPLNLPTRICLYSCRGDLVNVDYTTVETVSGDPALIWMVNVTR